MHWTPEYYVRLVSLPSTVRGVTMPNDDGSFDVYLNCNLSIEQQAICLQHELVHIMKDHFYNDKIDVTTCENEANSKRIS